MDELMSKLSDLLLSSGFQDPYFSGSDDERSMQALYDAILEALLSGGVLPDETLQQLLGEQADDGARRAARAVDPADHRADAGAAASSHRPRPRRTSAERRVGAGRAGRSAGHQYAVRGHRQGAGLPRLPRAAGPARIGRQEQLRPPRHARPGHRHRGVGRDQAVRVRRHAEPGRERDGPQPRAPGEVEREPTARSISSTTTSSSRRANIRARARR